MHLQRESTVLVNNLKGEYCSSSSILILRLGISVLVCAPCNICEDEDSLVADILPCVLLSTMQLKSNLYITF